MPPWPSRLHLASPVNGHTPSTTKEKGAKSPPTRYNQRLDAHLQEPPLIGVPILPSTESVVLSPPKSKSRHGRSHSNPFISMFASGKKTDKTLDAETQDEALVRPVTSSSGLLGKDPMARSGGLPVQHAEKDLVAGNCSTCDTTMKWPKQVDSYRCQICLMINDLKPSNSPLGQALVIDAPGRQCPTLSLEKTQFLIDECLSSYLQSRLDTDRSYAANRISSDDDTAPNSAMPMPVPPRPLHTYAPGSTSIPSPSRAPPPPPKHAFSPVVTNGSGTADPQPSSQDAFRSIFRPLENYIIACFTSMECLNTSFSTHRNLQLRRAASESTVTEPSSPPQDGKRLVSTSPFPELDAKTLLLGDFAENGMWWTGKGQLDEQRVQSNAARAPEGILQERVTSKTPRINWAEVNEWYRVITSIVYTWRDRVEKFRLGNCVRGTKVTAQNPSQDTLNDLEDDIIEASAHVQRTLLKASENILRRPGRPLRRPEDCRFLLILLANPLLYTSESIPVIDAARTKPPNPANPIQRSAGQSASMRSPEALKSHKRSPSSKSGSVGKHSGIIKRIFGLLANLSSESHYYLVNWFSRFSEPHFRKIVELVGSFVSYRLSRQHARKRSDSHDPHGGLIPDISGPGAGTSAQLHAALGTSTPQKSPEKKDSRVPYSEDWQIRVAARVMSLLFSANIQVPLRLQEATKAVDPAVGRKRAGSGSRNGAHPHSQILPISTFYNTLLDNLDLVADFELWESRRGRFSFCQYPMFLSIWAKIRIMEHDVRRQMEIKAREAFFNSILNRKAVSQYLVLRVRRECLVEDSLRSVSEIVGSGQDDIKKGLRIDFVGEEGLDSGGLRKEWFLLLVREVFEPEHGLFIYDEETHYCYFNPNSFETSDQFFLVGVVLGLAIYNSTILDVALPPFAFRKLLASAPSYTGPTTSSVRSVHTHTLEDLAEFRPSLARGLRQMLEFEGNVEETYCRDFVAVVERYGQVDQVPLCSNGENRPVTNCNRHEFVDLYVKYILDISVTRQYEPFKRGFFSVCEGNALSLFRPEEIEVLVRGSDEPLDVNTLRAVAIYDGWGKGTDPADEPVVEWFWESFTKANTYDQRKMLRFITSSDRIPAMGAMCLTIKVSCLGDDSERFPIARTCFNMLGIYRYRTKEKLEEKLWRAVNESEGFGIK